MTQLNGITIQPKIGSDFSLQYGEGNNITGCSTMVNTASPSSQYYNTDKVPSNTDTSKLAQNLAKYDIAQAAVMPETASKQWIG